MKVVKPIIVEFKEKYDWEDPKLIAQAITLSTKMLHEQAEKAVEQRGRYTGDLPLRFRNDRREVRTVARRLAEDCVEIVQYGEKLPSFRIAIPPMAFTDDKYLQSAKEFARIAKGADDPDDYGKVYQTRITVTKSLIPLVEQIALSTKQTVKLMKSAGKYCIEGWRVYYDGGKKAGFVHYCGIGQSYYSRSMERNVKCKKCNAQLTKRIRGALFVSEQKVV